VIEHWLEAIQIETISNIVIIDFAEELMILETDEPVYPSLALI
jgi:hypothetical protein